MKVIKCSERDYDFGKYYYVSYEAQNGFGASLRGSQYCGKLVEHLSIMTCKERLSRLEDSIKNLRESREDRKK